MDAGGIFTLKRERVATERQIALIRLLLCITGSLVIYKWYGDRFLRAAYTPAKEIVMSAGDAAAKAALKAALAGDSGVDAALRTATKLAPYYGALLPIYGAIILFLVYRQVFRLSITALVTTVTDLVLISFLVATLGSAIPFNLWYVFFVVTVAIRYGWSYSVLALSASIVSSTWITLQSPGGTTVNIAVQLGFTGFLLVLAFMFGRISEKQLSYQASLAVVNEFRLELAGLATSAEVISHTLARAKGLLKVEETFFLPARRGADGSEAPGLRSAGADPVLLATFREAGGAWNVERVLNEQRPMLTNNPARDPSLADNISAKAQIRNLAAAPMMVRSTPVGVVYAANRKDKGFSSSDLELLELIATQAAPVVENALLWERLRESAASEERLRIARDLHDNFLQTLAAIKLHLERCKILVAKDPERALEGIERIHVIATRGLGEVRSYLSELRLMGPEPSRFRQAIERCAADAAARGGFETDLDLNLPDEPIPPNVALAGFQILRELMNNVAAHAAAKHVRVSVKVQDDRLVLEVSDDGKGFEVTRERAEKASAGHLGLVGVEERAKQANGTFTITGEPGKGTRATAILRI
jgi:signal transduction histidine kinase